jgi:hypothetical protein
MASGPLTRMIAMAPPGGVARAQMVSCFMTAKVRKKKICRKLFSSFALRLKPFDLYLEVGMGCDIYLPFFKLNPELKFCFGLLDIIRKDRSDLIDNTLMKYTQSVNGGRSRMIVLTLNFE